MWIAFTAQARLKSMLHLRKIQLDNSKIKSSYTIPLKSDQIDMKPYGLHNLNLEISFTRDYKLNLPFLLLYSNFQNSTTKCNFIGETGAGLASTILSQRAYKPQVSLQASPKVHINKGFLNSTSPRSLSDGIIGSTGKPLCTPSVVRID